jgi:hypothetical protein
LNLQVSRVCVPGLNGASPLSPTALGGP